LLGACGDDRHAHASERPDDPEACGDHLPAREDNESGAELYAGVLSGGGQQSFNSAKRYWLRVGLPEALTISVNGASHTVGGDFGEFLVTETGPEREQTSSTTTTE
jgi:hypothetical protein